MIALSVAYKTIKKISKHIWKKIKEADENGYVIDKKFSEMRERMREKYYLHGGGRGPL